MLSKSVISCQTTRLKRPQFAPNAVRSHHLPRSSIRASAEPLIGPSSQQSSTLGRFFPSGAHFENRAKVSAEAAGTSRAQQRFLFVFHKRQKEPSIALIVCQLQVFLSRKRSRVPGYLAIVNLRGTIARLLLLRGFVWDRAAPRIRQTPSGESRFCQRRREN